MRLRASVEESFMDKSKVCQTLYDQFGNEEFLTREIPDAAIRRLSEALGFTEYDTHHSRNTRIGRAIGSLEGYVCTLENESQAIMYVYRPENPRLPRSFQLVTYRPVDIKLRAEALASESRRVGGPYSVVLVGSSEGWAAFCPALPGCASQGDDEEEAISNIEEAINGWLVTEREDIELRTQAILDDFGAEGYSAKLVKVRLA